MSPVSSQLVVDSGGDSSKHICGLLEADNWDGEPRLWWCPRLLLHAFEGQFTLVSPESHGEFSVFVSDSCGFISLYQWLVSLKEVAKTESWRKALRLRIAYKIFLKHYQGLKQTWGPGEVSKKLGSVLYEVVANSGQKHARHANQLRPCLSLADPLFECPEAPRVQKEEASISPRNIEDVAQAGRSFHNNEASPPTPYLRRSTRARQAPFRIVHNSKGKD
uniref:Uncharacterized protein n=1 Tax=Ditylenchus dipsaci TaxID=166011 RepID=A0A915CRM2_9BILA